MAWESVRGSEEFDGLVAKLCRWMSMNVVRKGNVNYAATYLYINDVYVVQPKLP